MDEGCNHSTSSLKYKFKITLILVMQWQVTTITSEVVGDVHILDAVKQYGRLFK